MTSDELLSRLVGVRRTGAGRWLARCPAHDDRSPSLSIRELEDGRLLIHCFSGCSADEVVTALHLRLEDLFPSRSVEHVRGAYMPFPALDVLRAVADEARLLTVAACNLGQGVELADGDRARLMLAGERIAEGLRLAGVAP